MTQRESAPQRLYVPGLAYPWHNADGALVLFHQRVSIREEGVEIGKAMPWWKPSGRSKADGSVKDFDSGALYPAEQNSGEVLQSHKNLIYRLPDVLQALSSGASEIWLPEGENDVETLRKLGYVASTGWGGAGQWSPAQAEWFRGYTGTVVVVVDNDGPGAAEGVRKFDTLTALGVRVALYSPPEGHNDLSEMVAAGWDVQEVEERDIDDLRATAVEAASNPTARTNWLTYGQDPETLSHLVHLLDPPAPPREGEPNLEDAAWIYEHKRMERLRRQVKRAVDAEEALADWQEPPSHLHMGLELDLEERPIVWTVEDLHERGTNTLLVAGYKTGKTVLALNLLKSLADNEPFLGFKSALPDDGRRVAFWNYELTEDQARRWVRELGVEHPERISHLPLRGYRMPLQTDQIVEWAVRWLDARDVKVWVIDPFAEAFDGDENDNSEVRVWLQNLNEIKRRAGVEDVWLVVHSGHAEQEEGRERARGASRLEGWKDVGWYYAKHPDNDGLRFLRAFGRDVSVSNFAVRMDPRTRGLSRDSTSEGMTRDQVVADSKARKVAEIVARHPGINATALRRQLGKGTNEAKDDWIELAEDMGLIRREVGGPGKPTLHFPVEPEKFRLGQVSDD